MSVGLSVELSKEEKRAIIAKRIAKEFKDGDTVNLGVGLPTLAVKYIPEGVNVMLHSENGFIGLGGKASEDNIDEEVVDSGGAYVTMVEGACCFDSAMSFGIIRGKHLDMTVLGALQVDEKGNLANWTIPNKMVPGMGGAMDLVIGAKKVILAMEHTVKGKPKIIKECNLPLTAKNVVDMIITEMGTFEFIDSKLTLTELNENYTLEDIRNYTEADYDIKLK